MSISLNKSQIEPLAKQLIGFMCDDIDDGIKGRSNYLCALGLSTYTEVLGGYLNGNLGPGNSERNYNAFLRYFPSCYQSVDGALKSAGFSKGLYEVVRSGLVHEYYIKDKSSIQMNHHPAQTCGISFVRAGSIKVTFFVKKYFEDFKLATKEYYEDLMNRSTSSNLVQRYNDALNSIGSILLSDPAHSTKQSGAGFSVQGTTI